MEASIYTSQGQEDAARSLDESTMVEKVARIVASVRGSKPDYTRLAAELEQAIPFDVFGIVLWHHDHQAVRVMVCHRAFYFAQDGAEARQDEQRGAAHWDMHHHQHPFKDSMLEQLSLTEQMVVKDYLQGVNGPPAESGDALSGYPRLHSTLIIPLKVEERILGTLEFGDYRPGVYANERRQRLIKAVAHVVATTIEGAQSGGSAEIQNRQREALKHVSHALTEKVDLATILHHIVEGISQSLNVASAIITQDTEGHLHLEAQAGLQEYLTCEILKAYFPVHDRCIVGASLLHGRPYTSHNILEDARFPDSIVLFKRLGIRSIYCYPLISESAIYGIMLLCSTETGGFTPLKEDILSLFASQATIAFRNNILLATLERRTIFQESVEQLEQAINASNQMEETSADILALLARVREETQSAFGVNFSTLMRFISERLLTQDERNAPVLSLADASSAIYPGEQERMGVKQSIASVDQKSIEQMLSATSSNKTTLASTLSRLIRSTGTTLVRADMLGELSELLMTVKASTDGVKEAWFVIDLQGMCIYMNPAAEQFCGIAMTTLEEYPSLSIEQAFAQVIPRMRNAKDVQHYLRNIVTGNSTQQKLRCTLAAQPISLAVLPQPPLYNSVLSFEPVSVLSLQEYNGLANKQRERQQENVASDHYYHLTLHPLYDNKEQLVCYALGVGDITEQVRDEKNRSALLSAVSHDLRTPLTIIKAAVTGLLQEGMQWEEQDQKSVLAEIDAGTDHLTLLVNALVDLSRIEMGALVLEKEWCDVVEVAHQAISRAKRVIEDRPVLLYSHSSLPLAFLDYAQIERVFIHLLANAARTSPANAKIILAIDVVTPQSVMPHIHDFLALRYQTQLLRVRVIDGGASVPGNEHELIFQSRYGTQSYGNELGLSICRGIVEEHQGNIWVESVPGSIIIDGEEIALEYVGEKVEEVEKAGSCFVFIVPVHPYGTATEEERIALSQEVERSQQGKEKDA